jgi:hypothetical protein
MEIIIDYENDKESNHDDTDFREWLRKDIEVNKLDLDTEIINPEFSEVKLIPT